MRAACEIPDRRMTYGLVFAMVVQFAAALIWAGAAAERLDALERTQPIARADHVRLARLETRLEAIAAQLDRIEARLEAGE